MELLLLSNSTNFGSTPWAHARDVGRPLVEGRTVTFVPYALADHDGYTAAIAEAFAPMGAAVVGLHTFADPAAALRASEVVYVVGGNTWRLLKTLQDADLLGVLRERVLAGMPYLGASAGTNLACPTIRTTNDMPIVQPPSFTTFGLVPFQINPHYLHGNPPGFKGETREERIIEFLTLNPQRTVAGLREGVGFRVEGESIELVGDAQCRVFRHGQTPLELAPGDDCTFLLRRG